MKLDVIFALLVLASLGTQNLQAGRPLITDDAGTVDLHKWQIEAGVDFAKTNHDYFTATPAKITFGILPDLEFGVGCGTQFVQGPTYQPDALINPQWRHEEGILDVGFETKWNFWKQEQGWLSQTLKFGVSIPTANYNKGLGSGRMNTEFTYIATRDIQEGLAVDFNLGYLYFGDRHQERYDDLIFYSLAGRWAFMPKWEAVMEIVAETPTTKFDQTAIGTNLGVRYEVTPGLTLDAAIGTKLLGDWPDLTATMGLTWNF